MAKRYDKKTAYHYGMYLAMQGRFDEYSFSKDADGYIIEKENEDASQRLAFGLCKKYGIDLPKGATPGDAWAALKEKTGKTASDFYNQSGSSGADKNGKPEDVFESSAQCQEKTEAAGRMASYRIDKSRSIVRTPEGKVTCN